jgi:hypothetical protein
MNKLYIKILLLYLLIGLVLGIYIYNRDYEYFINLTNRSDISDVNSYEVVISRYNENLNWIRDKPLSEMSIICYNKGTQQLEDVCEAPTCSIYSLKNVGRESHTYLYHIINNYDKLAPVTIFLPGSAMDEHKRGITLGVIKKVMKTGTTVLRGDYGTFPDDIYDFKIDEWKSTNSDNKTHNGEKGLLLSPIRPYGKWYESKFGKTKVKVFCYYSIFAVAREHIIQKPKSFYENLLKELDTSSNPEVGHYMERAWGAVFYPYPEECIYDDYNPNRSVFTD